MEATGKTRIREIRSFFRKKDVVISAHRYGVDAMGAMAQGLFASLLIGTIVKTLGEQLGLAFLVTAGGYATAVAGPAMAASIGYALHAPQLVLFSLIAVGGAANELGGAGGPLAVYLIAIIAAECGKLVSKETRVDILVTHAPAAGLGDRPDEYHRGFDVFRDFLDAYKPSWHFFGHVHKYSHHQEVLEYGSTTLINAYGYKILEI